LRREWRESNMNELCYCQYAFAQPKCRVQEVGPGVDPHYNVELIRQGPIAAVVSRVALGEFAPERLLGKTAEDIQWLRKVATRHNEIICHAATSSAVLPLRLGTVFQSRDSLLAMLARCQSTVAPFLEQLGNRQEWGVKLYLANRRQEPVPGHLGPPPPHYFGPQRGTNPSFDGKTSAADERRTDNANPFPSATSGTAYLTQKKAMLDSRREQRASVYQTIQTVEQSLTSNAEHCCRIRTLPSDLTGRSEEMVYNAAFLLPSSRQGDWLETIEKVHRDTQSKGLVLEVSGPWPPYHFCPTLEL
jgi:hypothetical protein